MNKYCCLLNGQNFLVQRNGVEAKNGFFQKLIVQANGPDQAKLLATTRIWHDPQLKDMILNAEDDPPTIDLKTIWELDIVDDPDEIDPERFFYIEYKWWQFIKRYAENKKIMEIYGELLKNE